VRVQPFELLKGGSNAVPPDRFEVLDEATSARVPDLVEADGVNAPAREEFDPLRTTPRMEHRYEELSGFKPLQGGVRGAPQDENQILLETFLIGAEAHAGAPGAVVAWVDVHSGAVAVLENDAGGTEFLQMCHEIGEEVAPFPRLLVHARKPHGRRGAMNRLAGVGDVHHRG
jgi:hypothetical protein